MWAGQCGQVCLPNAEWEVARRSSSPSQTLLSGSWWDPLRAQWVGERAMKSTCLCPGCEAHREARPGGVWLSLRIQPAGGMCTLRRAWHTVDYCRPRVWGARRIQSTCPVGRALMASGCSPLIDAPASGRMPASPPSQRHVGRKRRGRGGGGCRHCKRLGGTMHPWVACSKNRKAMKELCEKQTWALVPNLRDGNCSTLMGFIGWSRFFLCLTVWALNDWEVLGQICAYMHHANEVCFQGGHKFHFLSEIMWGIVKK